MGLEAFREHFAIPSSEQMNEERLYYLRFKPRDKDVPWETHPQKLLFNIAQDLADTLWDEGNFTTITAVSSTDLDIDNIT